MRPLPPELVSIPRSGELPNADALIVPQRHFVDALKRQTAIVQSLRRLYPLYVEVAEAAVRSDPPASRAFGIGGYVRNLALNLLDPDRKGAVPCLLDWAPFSALCDSDRIPAAVTLRDRIQELAAQFKVSEEWMKGSTWMLNAILVSFFATWTLGGATHELDLHVLRSEPDVAQELRLVVTALPGESPDEFMERADAEYRAARTAYLETAEFRPAIDLWEVEPPAQVRSTDQFDWLVLYNVLNIGLTDLDARLAQEGKAKDTSTIWRGIERAAEVIGVRLREKSDRHSRHRAHP